MRVDNIFDVAGAIILLAIISTIALHPKVVGTLGTTFTGAIKAAKG